MASATTDDCRTCAHALPGVFGALWCLLFDARATTACGHYLRDPGDEADEAEVVE